MSFMFGDDDISNLEMSTYNESDIPETHTVLVSSMENWELPNQVVALEVE